MSSYSSTIFSHFLLRFIHTRCANAHIHLLWTSPSFTFCFLAFCVIFSRTHRHTASNPSATVSLSLCYDGTTVHTLSTRPLSPLIFSFISPLAFSLDDNPISCSLATETLVTFHVSLHDGTLKHLSNSILEPHHIDPLRLLLFYNPITYCFFALLFSCFPAMCYCITTLIHISCTISQCSDKGTLGLSRYSRLGHTVFPRLNWGQYFLYVHSSCACAVAGDLVSCLGAERSHGSHQINSQCTCSASN